MLDDLSVYPIQRSKRDGYLVVEAVYGGETLTLRAEPSHHEQASFGMLERQLRAKLAYVMGLPVGFTHLPGLWVKGPDGKPAPV